VVPYDRDTVAASVRKTGRLIVSHQAPERCGYAAEVIQCVIEDAFDYLDAPPVRLCGANMPVPYAKSLEDAAMPQVDDIVAAARRLMHGSSITRKP
jgi:pyruvate/2-oxoglutarate/acetoin dehydrogenase E1 component